MGVKKKSVNISKQDLLDSEETLEEGSGKPTVYCYNTFCLLHFIPTVEGIIKTPPLTILSGHQAREWKKGWVTDQTLKYDFCHPTPLTTDTGTPDTLTEAITTMTVNMNQMEALRSEGNK